MIRSILEKIKIGSIGLIKIIAVVMYIIFQITIGIAKMILLIFAFVFKIVIEIIKIAETN